MESAAPTTVKSVALVALGSSMAKGRQPKGYSETWTINNAHAAWKIKSDLIIAMDDFGRDIKTHPKYVESIVYAEIPVFTTHRYRGLPWTKPYPLREVVAFLPRGLAQQILDNTCNYALALAMCRGYRRIGLFGFDFCRPYSKDDPRCEIGLLWWKYDGYRNIPDWFKFYHRKVVRKTEEPGLESLHYLLGLAEGMGIKVRIHGRSSALNTDRDRFFYGYQKQPKVDLR